MNLKYFLNIWPIYTKKSYKSSKKNMNVPKNMNNHCTVEENK